MKSIPNSCSIRHVIVSPREIHFVRFILEAYEGLGVVTTLEPRLGLLQLSIAPGCEEDVERILNAERTRLKLRSVLIDPATGEPEVAMAHTFAVCPPGEE